MTGSTWLSLRILHEPRTRSGRERSVGRTQKSPDFAAKSSFESGFRFWLDYKATIRLGTKVPKSLPNRPMARMVLIVGDLHGVPRDGFSRQGRLFAFTRP